MTDESTPSADAFRVVRGQPNEDELAAVIAVLSAAADERPEAQPVVSSEPNSWSKSQRSMRTWDQSKRWS